MAQAAFPTKTFLPFLDAVRFPEASKDYVEPHKAITHMMKSNPVSLCDMRFLNYAGLLISLSENAASFITV